MNEETRHILRRIWREGFIKEGIEEGEVERLCDLMEQGHELMEAREKTSSEVEAVVARNITEAFPRDV